jgi:hypothetical protein
VQQQVEGEELTEGIQAMYSWLQHAVRISTPTNSVKTLTECQKSVNSASALARRSSDVATSKNQTTTHYDHTT